MKWRATARLLDLDGDEDFKATVIEAPGEHEASILAECWAAVVWERRGFKVDSLEIDLIEN